MSLQETQRVIYTDMGVYEVNLKELSHARKEKKNQLV
jgi:hypothetical protein